MYLPRSLRELNKPFSKQNSGIDQDWFILSLGTSFMACLLFGAIAGSAVDGNGDVTKAGVFTWFGITALGPIVTTVVFFFPALLDWLTFRRRKEVVAWASSEASSALSELTQARDAGVPDDELEPILAALHIAHRATIEAGDDEGQQTRAVALYRRARTAATEVQRRELEINQDKRDLEKQLAEEARIEQLRVRDEQLRLTEDEFDLALLPYASLHVRNAD